MSLKYEKFLFWFHLCNHSPGQVLTVSKFHGGGAFNVIPDSVTIGGTFRAFSRESLHQLKQRIDEVTNQNTVNLLLSTTLRHTIYGLAHYTIS